MQKAIAQNPVNCIGYLRWFRAISFAIVVMLGNLAPSQALAEPRIPDGICIDGEVGDCNHVTRKFNPGHYLLVFLGSGSEALRPAINDPGFRGVQKRWTWRELEPKRGQYNFQGIERDLELLRQYDKQLVIQVVDTKFTCEGDPFLPQYMLDDAEFNGGVVKPATGKCKWLPQRWLPSYVDRHDALMSALGSRFDRRPNVEAVVGTETALSLTCNELTSLGYTPEKYFSSLQQMMRSNLEAFPTTNVIIYQNFFPCKTANLARLIEYAGSIGHGMGGPDHWLYNKTLTEIVYPKQAEHKGRVVLGTAVQYGNYTQKHPDGRRVTAFDIAKFGVDEIDRDYMFWLYSPKFNDEVLTAVNAYPIK